MNKQARFHEVEGYNDRIAITAGSNILVFVGEPGGGRIQAQWVRVGDKPDNVVDLGMIGEGKEFFTWSPTGPSVSEVVKSRMKELLEKFGATVSESISKNPAHKFGDLMA